MGIKNLLPNLKSITNPIHISSYNGKIAGIDAYGWLYKGAYTCSVALVQGKDSKEYVDYCLNRIKLLENNNIKPFFVFDGAPLPIKKETHNERKTLRNKNYKIGINLLNKDKIASYSYLSRSMFVTYEMVYNLIKILKQKNINYIVAPYEADAQLSFLFKIKYIDFVISDDSDCIPYGSKIILFKMDTNGNGYEIKRNNMGANEELNFQGWSDTMFLQLCVLAGCDYCSSLPGIGIISAYKIVKEYLRPDKVLAALKDKKKLDDNENFHIEYYQAILTFRHHYVYNPLTKKYCMLNPLEKSKDILPYIKYINLSFLSTDDPTKREKDIIKGQISGDIHPVTNELRNNLNLNNICTLDSPLETTKYSSIKTLDSLENREYNVKFKKLIDQKYQNKNIATNFHFLIHNKNYNKTKISTFSPHLSNDSSNNVNDGNNDSKNKFSLKRKSNITLYHDYTVDKNSRHKKQALIFRGRKTSKQSIENEMIDKHTVIQENKHSDESYRCSIVSNTPIANKSNKLYEEKSLPNSKVFYSIDKSANISKTNIPSQNNENNSEEKDSSILLIDYVQPSNNNNNIKDNNTTLPIVNEDQMKSTSHILNCMNSKTSDKENSLKNELSPLIISSNTLSSPIDNLSTISSPILSSNSEIYIQIKNRKSVKRKSLDNSTNKNKFLGIKFMSEKLNKNQITSLSLSTNNRFIDNPVIHHSDDENNNKNTIEIIDLSIDTESEIEDNEINLYYNNKKNNSIHKIEEIYFSSQESIYETPKIYKNLQIENNNRYKINNSYRFSRFI